MPTNPNAIYMLEVYMPNSADDVWVYFESEHPFMAIHAGDIVNPSVWPNSQAPMKVLSVEHILWEAKGVAKHKICVFTEEVDGTRELRLTRK